MTNKQQFLTESKIDYILQNKKIIDLIAEKYRKDNNISSDKNISNEELAKKALSYCDKFTYTNKYMIWLIKQYVQNKFKIPEDLSKLNSELER